ncbi:BrnT family toxin [Bifidobacterium sp. ESL0745]|uniref:BrnT family toxin n=1 Tax=Bifidobacterium sp. ESL0745 TaxID=2983226 RepID=UPI0023F6FE0C|nr:BrnT family toxin [Bifidobacterium sp. ESL0745]
MDFEYDPNKSLSNLNKHSIDFEQAQALWDDPDLIEVRLAYADEPRWAVIGMMSGKHWTAIITYRGESTRIISVRRSHPKEEQVYENEKSS